MKYFLIILILFIYKLSFSQADLEYEIYVIDLGAKITNDAKKCNTGKKQALLDAKKGEYNYLIFKGSIDYNSEFNKKKYLFDVYYSNYIKKKYNLRILNLIVPRDFTKCYSIEMNKIIFKKYGENIISKSKKEALKEFKKGFQ